jgi:hypothetical protein
MRAKSILNQAEKYNDFVYERVRWKGEVRGRVLEVEVRARAQGNRSIAHKVVGRSDGALVPSHVPGTENHGDLASDVVGLIGSFHLHALASILRKRDRPIPRP